MTTELMEAPEPQDEQSEEVLIEGPIETPLYEHSNPDVRAVDAILRDVSWRSSVYAEEILDNLPDNPLSEKVFNDLTQVIAHIPSDGTKLLHSREYMDMLLDFRNELTANDN